MARMTVAVGLTVGAALVAALPSPAHASHQHWFFDSYGAYEGRAYPYYSRPQAVPGGPGAVYEYQVAPGQWMRVHPRAVFPQYAPHYRVIEPKRARVRAQPEETIESRVLPREKPQVPTAAQRGAPEPAEALEPDPRVTGSIERAPEALSTPEPQVAARGEEKSEDKAGKQMSCEAAAEIVSGFGFSDVKPISCSGSSYGFEARRDGAAYSITLNATDGELSEVKKR